MENFDRRTADAQIGYLTGRIEGIEERLEQHMDDEHKMQAKIGAQLSRIEEQLSMYRHLTFFIRSMALIIAAIIAFKWGVAKEIWTTFFNGGA
jgi:hypothetical protein